MRLIFADALLEDIEQTVRFSCREGVPSAEMRGANKIIDRIKAAPTISPDKVRGVGEWISERDGSIVELDEDGYVTDSCHCSVCNEHLDGSEEYAVKGNYCPSCGARMKGAEDGTTE